MLTTLEIYFLLTKPLIFGPRLSREKELECLDLDGGNLHLSLIAPTLKCNGSFRQPNTWRGFFFAFKHKLIVVFQIYVLPECFEKSSTTKAPERVCLFKSVNHSRSLFPCKNRSYLDPDSHGEQTLDVWT